MNQHEHPAIHVICCQAAIAPQRPCSPGRTKGSVRCGEGQPQVEYWGDEKETRSDKISAGWASMFHNFDCNFHSLHSELAQERAVAESKDAQTALSSAQELRPLSLRVSIMSGSKVNGEWCITTWPEQQLDWQILTLQYSSWSWSQQAFGQYFCVCIFETSIGTCSRQKEAKEYKKLKDLCVRAMCPFPRSKASCPRLRTHFWALKYPFDATDGFRSRLGIRYQFQRPRFWWSSGTKCQFHPSTVKWGRDARQYGSHWQSHFCPQERPCRTDISYARPWECWWLERQMVHSWANFGTSCEARWRIRFIRSTLPFHYLGKRCCQEVTH